MQFAFKNKHNYFFFFLRILCAFTYHYGKRNEQSFSQDMQLQGYGYTTKICCGARTS